LLLISQFKSSYLLHLAIVVICVGQMMVAWDDLQQPSGVAAWWSMQQRASAIVALLDFVDGFFVSTRVVRRDPRKILG
jgi:hypothetical protein